MPTSRRAVYAPLPSRPKTDDPLLAHTVPSRCRLRCAIGGAMSIALLGLALLTHSPVGDTSPVVRQISVTAGLRQKDTLIGNIVQLGGIFRDFHQSHPDFEMNTDSVAGFDRTKATLGLVENKLGADGKPVFKGCTTMCTITNQSTFRQWYDDVAGVNKRVEMPLNFTESSVGTLVAETQQFFPLDGMGWNDSAKDRDGKFHNFWFTLEMHTSFVYHGGEKFAFRGDDDIWVFINGSLVVDLGGLHVALPSTVYLDSLSLHREQSASLDIFYAERHTFDSDFRIETTIRLGEDACDSRPYVQLRTLAHSNLGGRGPDAGEEGLVYRASDFAPGRGPRDVVLQVHVKSGSTYVPGTNGQNGFQGLYGFISVKAGTNVTLVFSYRDPTKQTVKCNVSDPMTCDMDLTFFDLDQAAGGKSAEYVEVGSFGAVVLMSNTEVKQSQRADGKTRFSASTEGTAIDNPRDPNVLTVQQKNRAVTLHFVNILEVEVTLGSSEGTVDRDFLFAAKPSLLCMSAPHTGPDIPVPVLVSTKTTTTVTTTSTSTVQMCCAINIPIFRLQLGCSPQKSFWTPWC